jgi:hypothetical protein
MEKLLVVIFIFSCSCLKAQDYPYPTLPASALQLNDFVPEHWFIKDSTSGDLNGDAFNDIAIVIECKDTLPERRPDGEVNQGSPRILVVLIKNNKTNQYDLFLQNNTFIVRYGEGGMDPEAYGELKILKGVLQVLISFLRGTVSYKFRMQGGDLCLIGGTNSGVSGGKYYSFDANFNTSKAKVEEYSLEEKQSKPSWIELPKTPLKKLRDMTMPLQWEVVKNQFL